MNTERIKSEIRNKYNSEVDQYDNIFKNKSGKHFIKKKLNIASSYNYFNKNQKILEVGSATGIFSFEYEELGIDLTSIDLSVQNINWAKKKAKQLNSKINFIVADVEKLPFNNSQFDGVLSFSTLRYVPDIKQALHEIFRVIKPNGFVILDFPNKKCPWFGGLKKKFLGREHIYDNHYFVNDLLSLFKEVGYSDIIIKQGLFIPKSTPNYLFPFFVIFEFIAELIPFIRKTSAIIFVGAKKND